MAADEQSLNLKEEATCSICLEFFKNPVSIACGHNFCQECITQSWQGSGADPTCPQCRETSQVRNFRPNKQLGNIVEILKLHLSAAKKQEEEMCEKHQQRLQLFCEDDQKPICVVCDRSKEHKSHNVIPIDEAAQECKETLGSRLIELQKDLEDVKRLTEEQEELAKLEGEFQTQTERIRTIFEELQQFLAQQKQRFLEDLSKKQDENKKIISEKMTVLEKQNSSLVDLITEIKSKCQQQDVELLKDIKSILDRSGSVLSNSTAPAPVAIATSCTPAPLVQQPTGWNFGAPPAQPSSTLFGSSSGFGSSSFASATTSTGFGMPHLSQSTSIGFGYLFSSAQTPPSAVQQQSSGAAIQQPGSKAVTGGYDAFVQKKMNELKGTFPAELERLCLKTSNVAPSESRSGPAASHIERAQVIEVYDSEPLAVDSIHVSSSSHYASGAYSIQTSGSK